MAARSRKSVRPTGSPTRPRSAEKTPIEPGRQAEAEKIYFNAVGLSYIDVALAYAMYKRSLAAGADRPLVLQRTVLFEHQNLQSQLRL